MRKFKTVLVIAGLCFSLVACGKSENNVKSSESAEATSKAVQEQNNNKPNNDNNNSQQSSTQSAGESEAATESKTETPTKTNLSDVTWDNLKLVTDGKKLGELQKMSGNKDYDITSIDLVTASNSSTGEKEFKLNQKFKVFVATEDESISLDFYFIKNDNKVDYLKMTAEDFEAICNENKYPMLLSTVPDQEKHGYVDSTSIEEQCGAGLYNVIVTIFGYPYYMVQIRLK